MATKTSLSRRSSSRGSATGKPAASRRKVSSAAAKRKGRAKGRARGKPRPKRTPTRQILSPHARDAAGIGLVVFALLATLSLWFGAAGPVGDRISWLLQGLFGVGAYLFPIVGVFWGVVLLRDIAREDRVRMFIGFALLTLGVLGMVSLVRGDPSALATYGRHHHHPGFADAGGLVGALAAYPLSQVLSAYGAFVVEAGLAALGLLVFTGTSFAALREKVGGLQFPRRRARAVGDGAPEQLPMVTVPDTAPKEKKRKSASRRTKAVLDALGLTDDVVVILEPDAAAAAPPIEEPAPVAVKPDRSAKPRTIATSEGPYQLPPLDLLRAAPPSTNDGVHEKQVTRALGDTLTMFGVDARVVASHRGPTVTMYEVEVAPGTKVNKVLNLSGDIAYALATPDVRIIAPIPGRSAIGIEVPNKHRDFVMLGDILRSNAAKADTHPLSVALGKDIHGDAQMVNLATMPHLLIAGATGAGKSSLVNCFITSLLMRTTPDDVRLVLIDPKRVEMTHFAEVPHLLSPVIVHPKRAAEALAWIVREMELRYETLATVGVRDIDGYEEGLKNGTLRLPVGMEDRYEHLPYIVVVIDELADLMMVAPRAVEDAICRIAQMARAVGIHLVVATQRPSVDVVTGLIKANIPSRIALMTSSQADSRVVLDQNGAEKLVGHGDMLVAAANTSKPSRLQGAWVTQAEIHEVTAFIRGQRGVVYEQHIEGLGLPPTEAELAGGAGGIAGDDDDLLNQAAELIVRSQLGSTSMLQRKLKVGFARAGRLMDLLEEQGIVGPGQGSKARDVLLTPEEWEERRSA
jgi:S-DNA-T family DNA segregation ATPase FtsK/SpoIIIE